MSYLPPVVGRRAHFLFTLYVFVCVYSGVQHILCCVFVCLSSSCALYCRLLWIVHILIVSSLFSYVYVV
jgi:hypothetical protein